MVTEVDFQRAVRGPDYRQIFINGIDLEEASRYVRRVTYKHVDCDGPMTINILFLQRAGVPRLRSIINVYQKALDPARYESLGEFLSSLIDHEGFHARELYETPWIMTAGLWLRYSPFDKVRYVDAVFRARWGAEIRAIGNQLRKAQERGLSARFVRRLHERIEKYEAVLRTL